MLESVVRTPAPQGVVNVESPMNTANQMLRPPLAPRADDAPAGIAHGLRLPAIESQQGLHHHTRKAPYGYHRVPRGPQGPPHLEVFEPEAAARV
jgi:hypothetical protein